MQLIEVNTERLYSIITICNYDEYFEAEVNKPKDELKNEDTKLVEAPKEDKPKKNKRRDCDSNRKAEGEILSRASSLCCNLWQGYDQKVL